MTLTVAMNEYSTTCSNGMVNKYFCPNRATGVRTEHESSQVNSLGKDADKILLFIVFDI
jgi:hypothetical protein